MAKTKSNISREKIRAAKIKALQSKVDSSSLEGIILYFCKDKKFANRLLKGFVKDNPKYNRAQWLRWFRSFGLYYSKLPDK
ncbi:MAG: hypothetical protein U0V49_12040 [Saprospiraceae bacterium]